MSTVMLEPLIWSALQSNVLTEAQAIRLQELSNDASLGRQSNLSRRDQKLIDRLSLFLAKASPTLH